MTTIRRLTTMFVILATLLTGLAVHPATAKAADDPRPSLIQLAQCIPSTKVGEGPTVDEDKLTGNYKIKDSVAPYLQQYGGTCTILASTNLTLHLVSPVDVVAETNFVKYKETKFLLMTGTKFTITIKPGDNVKGLSVQIWYGFDSVDPFAPISTQFGTPPNYFAQTGHAIDNLFVKYWQDHGGLAQNGMPISDRGYHWLSGRLYQVQYFERARFEYHPENAAPYTIELGQFGRQVMEARVIHSNPELPGTKKDDTCKYDPNTSHYKCGAFAEYWETHGGLAQFGRPLTEEFTERLENGNTYTVQYFERARFEYHPENPAPYDILLGQFGRYVLGGIQAIRLESSGMKKP